MADKNPANKSVADKTLEEQFFVGAGERDATTIVRDASRVTLPKRFYKDVTVAERDNGFVILLDGKSVRTPRQTPVMLPTRATADMLAAEWAAQVDTLEPVTMPATRLVNAAIDGVATDIGAVAADIAKYAGSDLVCYRADEPPTLVAAQAAAWDPVLAWADATLGAKFHVTRSIVFVTQPRQALDAVTRAISALAQDAKAALRVAALHVATTLTGSALLALSLHARALTPDATWAAAHVDEDEQMRVWGLDADALRRRAGRQREFMAAWAMLEALD